MDVGRKVTYVPIVQVGARGRGSQEPLQARAKEEMEDWERWEARKEADLKEVLKAEKETGREVEKDSAGKRAEAKAGEAKAGLKEGVSFVKDRIMRTNAQLRRDK